MALAMLMFGVALAGLGVTLALSLAGRRRAATVVMLLPVAGAGLLTFLGGMTGGGRGLEQAAIAAFILLPMAVGALLGMAIGAIVNSSRRGRGGP